MKNNVKTVVERNVSHYMIINETCQIESKLDDSNFPQKQVCKTNHLWVKYKDFEEYFDMHNLDNDELSVLKIADFSFCYFTVPFWNNGIIAKLQKMLDRFDNNKANRE